MRIGIVGNYGNNNNGDEAILAGIIVQLEEFYNIPKKNIVVFSNNPPQTSNRFGVSSSPLYYKRSSAILTFMETMKINSPLIRELDFLIIGGGGILMDFYNREAQLFGSYGMMAKRAKVPYIIYSCGAGPLNSTMGKWFIRHLLSNAASVSVRDPKSRQLLKAIGVKREIEVVGDPSFALVPVRTKAPTPGIKKIGVTVVPYYNLAYWPEADHIKYDNYVQSMATNLDALIENQDVEVTLFSTKYPHDVDVTEDVFKRMVHQEKVSINRDNLTPQELIEISAEQDLVIGTRLHSVYLAVNAETPVVAIAYHHKVRDFMEMVELGDNCVRIEDLIKDDTILSKKIDNIKLDWQGTNDKAVELAAMMKAKTKLGMTQFIPDPEEKL
ncbi:polysaccharide pyruvyl transferase family protein [Planococcus beigongshangi]|uniref:polysaccharide pyruvyl transferase family protein n=1 Tax=Planococcus beigongshangi TaxID=2782536 RepID=UPI00193BC0AC|nr:polysaccharide pyruvyl transferase family protein [Planococcus beigongshangi]